MEMCKAEMVRVPSAADDVEKRKGDEAGYHFRNTPIGTDGTYAFQPRTYGRGSKR